jgi:hypothetical protein
MLRWVAARAFMLPLLCGVKPKHASETLTLLSSV